MKNGHRKGKQLYICADCRYQFRTNTSLTDEDLWNLYQNEKQTIAELSKRLKVSESTIKRRLAQVVKEWKQPSISGSDFVHIDATYWGRNSGIILAISEKGEVLYMDFITHETLGDYQKAIASIQERGFVIKGLIFDGFKCLFKNFAQFNLQMCQFHMIQIVRRGLTNNPKLLSSCQLLSLVKDITKYSKEEFEAAYNAWKIRWKDTIMKKTASKVNGKLHYTHKRLRTVMHSIDFYLPYLFTYQEDICKGMANTNNKIEGRFTDLKKNMNNHSGMSAEGRKRFIIGFFLA